MPTRRNFLQLSVVGLASGLLAACKSSQTIQIATLPPGPTPTPADTPKVLLEKLDYPSGIAFSPDGTLWCSELEGRYLDSWTNGKIHRYSMEGRPNGIVFDRKSRAWVCDSEQYTIRRFDPYTNTWEMMVTEVDGRPLQNPHDLAFDSTGNLLFTCPNTETLDTTGYIGCLNPSGQVVKVAEGFFRPYGLAFAEKGATLVIDDFFSKKLYRGAWDPEKMLWERPMSFAEVSSAGNGPDGIYAGADGLIYTAIYGEAKVLAVDLEGKVKLTIDLNGSNPTSVAVDPSGNLGLLVTEASRGQLLSLPWIQPGVTTFDGGDAWS